MPPMKILEARTTGTQLEVPNHPRVEPLTVSAILKKRPSPIHSVDANALSLDALRLMSEHDIEAVPVLDGGALIGIFSEREHARNSALVEQLAVATPVRDAMVPCNVFAAPTDSAQYCFSLMRENRLRYLPVQDQGTLVAVLSLDDLLSEIVAHHQRVFRASELDQQILFLRGTYSC